MKRTRGGGGKSVPGGWGEDPGRKKNGINAIDLVGSMRPEKRRKGGSGQERKGGAPLPREYISKADETI